MSEIANVRYGYRSHKYEVTPQGLLCAKCQHIKPTHALHRNRATHTGSHTWRKACRKMSQQAREVPA